jgi:hypothetical protein
VVVCHGKGCSVTFSSVTFANCTLVVLAGARATINSCSFTRCTTQPKGVSVFVHGGSTYVRMHGGSITGGTQAVTVQGGALMETVSLTVSQMAISGVEVAGFSSRLKVAYSALRQFPTCTDACAVVRGAFAHSGGTLELSNTTIASVQLGVVAISRALASLTDCVVSNTADTCVTVMSGASVKLAGCSVMWSANRHGVHAEGSGSFLEASKCKFVEHSQSAIFAQDGAKVTANTCKTFKSKTAGYAAHSRACIELTGCTSDADCRGCVVSTGGLLRASFVVISDAAEEGCLIQKGGIGSITGCRINKCGEQGVWVTGAGSTVAMHSCTVTETQRSCVALLCGAHGRLHGCVLCGSVKRSGVVAENPNTKLVLEGCTLQGNEQCGLLADDTAVVEASGCRSIENRGSSGYSAQSGAKVTVQESFSMGDKKGVGVFDGGSLSVENVTVDGTVIDSRKL